MCSLFICGCVCNERHVQHHPLDILSARVHLDEALLIERLDPGLQNDHNTVGDIDNDVDHQQQAEHAPLLMALQLLPRGLHLDVEAGGTCVSGEGIDPIVVLTFVHYSID